VAEIEIKPESWTLVTWYRCIYARAASVGLDGPPNAEIGRMRYS